MTGQAGFPVACKAACEGAQGGQRPANCYGLQRTYSLWIQGNGKKNSSKLIERTGNVYENKGSVWKTCPRILYVYEKTGSCPLNPGMLFKTNGLLGGQGLLAGVAGTPLPHGRQNKRCSNGPAVANRG